MIQVSRSERKRDAAVAPTWEIEDVETAKAVCARLLALPASTIHACDTEVADIEIRKSPIGQGRVICVSVYSGPDVDYGRGPGHPLAFNPA